MKKRIVKSILAGALAMSMAVGTPVVTFAQQAEGSDMAAFVETRAKQEKNKKPENTAAKAQEVGKITCTSAGKVNISFKQKVTFTDALKAVITDESGREITCKISKKNKSLLTVSVSGLVKGQKYTLRIDGILGKDSAEPVVIQKEFTAKGMKTKSKVGKVSVESGKFVVLKMNSAAYYKDAEVIVKDSTGNVCTAKIVKKAKGNVKVQIDGMKKGEKYTITINGIKTKKEKNYGSITRTVTVK